jgi:hypothetical protein
MGYGFYRGSLLRLVVGAFLVEVKVARETGYAVLVLWTPGFGTSGARSKLYLLVGGRGRRRRRFRLGKGFGTCVPVLF